MNFDDKIRSLEERVTLLERAETLRQPIGAPVPGEEFKLRPPGFITRLRPLNDDLTAGEPVATIFTLPMPGRPGRDEALVELKAWLALEGFRIVGEDPSTPA